MASRAHPTNNPNASLCIRLYKGKDRLTKPDVTTEDGKRISDGVATMLADNRMSVRKASALLVTRTRTNQPRPAGRTNEDVGREWLKVLAQDDLITILRQLHDVEWLKELAKKLAVELEKVLRPEATAPPSPTGAAFKPRV